MLSILLFSSSSTGVVDEEASSRWYTVAVRLSDDNSVVPVVLGLPGFGGRWGGGAEALSLSDCPDRLCFLAGMVGGVPLFL